jgi:hypothetical protein
LQAPSQWVCRCLSAPSSIQCLVLVLYFNHLHIRHHTPYQYPPYSYPPPPAAPSTGAPTPYHTLVLRPMVWRTLLHHIRTLLFQSVVRWVVMLLQHIHTLHLQHIHILHFKLFTLEVVTTQVKRKTPLIQLKLCQEWRKEMSRPAATKKICQFSISSFCCRSFDYHVVLAN